MVGGRRATARGPLWLAGTTTLAQPAHAGAWAMAEGVQQWFAAVSHETGDLGEAWRADDFIEFGLGENWAINAKIESEIRISDIYDDRTGFQVGVLKAFALTDRASFAVQASLCLAAKRWRVPNARTRASNSAPRSAPRSRCSAVRAL